MHVNWARNKEEEKKKKEMMMMIGFLDGVNVRHKCAARGRSVIKHLCSLCQERAEECYECLE
jgi:hypothetical protein